MVRLWAVVWISKLSGPIHGDSRRFVTSSISIFLMSSSPFRVWYLGVRQISLTLSWKS